MGCLALDYYQHWPQLRSAESRAARGSARIIALTRKCAQVSEQGLFLSTEKAAQRSLKGTENKCAGSYRFGFNGKYKDNEVAGVGNTYNFNARMYNSRIGRFFSIDPWTKKYPSMSPYAGMDNSPISLVDPTGKGADYYIKLSNVKGVAVIEVLASIATGDKTPNRLFVSDPDATKNTKNRKEFNGGYYRMAMIPQSVYSEADHQTPNWTFQQSQFDMDRDEYINRSDEYNDKTHWQKVQESVDDDDWLQGDLKFLVSRYTGRRGGGTSGNSGARSGGGNRKGERNKTAKPSGTDNPFKHLKPDPKKPGNVLQKDPHTGKEVSKPAPEGYPPPQQTPDAPKANQQ